MTSRKKVGVRVDAEAWARFREWVEDRHGQTRGVLGDELETAIRRHMGESPDEDLRTMVAEVHRAVVPAQGDGGLSRAEHTHARRPEHPPKPREQAPRRRKVDYLLAVLGEVNETTRDRLCEVVEREFGFGERTQDRLVDRLVERLDLREDPRRRRRQAGILLSPERYDEVVDALRAEHAEAAESELDELDESAKD